MSEPVMVQKAPFKVDVEEGKSYFYCACGKSETQPFCDGSHKDTSFQPVRFTAEKTGTAYFCGCRASGKSPLCDGAHNKL